MVLDKWFLESKSVSLSLRRFETYRCQLGVGPADAHLALRLTLSSCFFNAYFIANNPGTLVYAESLALAEDLVQLSLDN
jgi:hypothetical protein